MSPGLDKSINLAGQSQHSNATRSGCASWCVPSALVRSKPELLLSTAHSFLVVSFDYGRCLCEGEAELWQHRGGEAEQRWAAPAPAPGPSTASAAGLRGEQSSCCSSRGWAGRGVGFALPRHRAQGGMAETVCDAGCAGSGGPAPRWCVPPARAGV